MQLKIFKKDKKVSIITLAFSMSEYEKVKNAYRLSTTKQDLLHLMNEFRKKHNLKKDVTLHFFDDLLQKTKTDTCGIFQLYFYVNLFNPIEISEIINDKTLTKNSIEKLINEIVFNDKNENESRIEAFIGENEIVENSRKTRIVENFIRGQYSSIYNLHLLKIVDFGRVSNVLRI